MRPLNGDKDFFVTGKKWLVV